MRQHIEHLLAASGALAFALLISYFNTGTVVRVAPPVHSSATLRPIASDADAFATTSLPGIADLASSTLESLLPSKPKPAPKPATTPAVPLKLAPKPQTPPAPAPAPSTPAPKPAPSSAAATSSAPTEQNSDGSSAVRARLQRSLVNILCYAHDGSLRSVSGSGVIIDTRGTILTVAHVAQMLLLEQYLGSDKIDCVIRTGSPAHDAYLARPIYVPQEWVKDNSTTLISSQPTGTGERDYALLAITDSATGSPLPTSFPALPLEIGSPRVGDPVSIGSYGAQELTSAQIRSSLYPTLATSTIISRFTFNRSTIDVLEIAGSAASQEGSSGGAIVNADGALIGIITTSEVSGPISARKLHAITASYILHDFSNATGQDFLSHFNSSLITLVNSYSPTAMQLGESIAKAIGL